MTDLFGNDIGKGDRIVAVDTFGYAVLREYKVARIDLGTAIAVPVTGKRRLTRIFHGNEITLVKEFD